LATNFPLPEELFLKIRELETEVSELKTQLDSLTKFSKEHARYLAMAVGHVLEGMSILRYYSNRVGITVGDIDGAFESISDLQYLHDTCNFLETKHEIGNYMGRLMSCVIELCGDARISSTQLLETLQERFDKETLLKTLVAVLVVRKIIHNDAEITPWV
jgi:hypothetical protein